MVEKKSKNYFFNNSPEKKREGDLRELVSEVEGTLALTVLFALSPGRARKVALVHLFEKLNLLDGIGPLKRQLLAQIGLMGAEMRRKIPREKKDL